MLQVPEAELLLRRRVEAGPLKEGRGGQPQEPWEDGELMGKKLRRDLGLPWQVAGRDPGRREAAPEHASLLDAVVP